MGMGVEGWGGISVFALRAPDTWMRPSYILTDNLLYSKLTDLNVNHFKNTLTTIPNLYLTKYPSTIT